MALVAHTIHTQRVNADQASRPNIVLIMTDDLGYGDLGCYGQQRIQTPNIDRMAKEGLRFTDHYAGHTVCRPSRLVLWLGQHVGHTGLIGNRPRSLTSKEPTVAKLLQAVGYKTGGVGKWALGHVEKPSDIDNAGHPNRNGFDYWYGYLNQSNAHNFYPTFLWENSRQVELLGNVIDPRPAGRGRVSSKRVSYSHDFMSDAAFEFIRRSKNHPFLLHVHWTIPHANNEGGRVTGDGMEIPSHGIYAEQDWPNPEKGFAAMITHMDRDVGRLFELLKELKIDERTLVCFTSDNGPHNEGGHNHEFFNSNGDLTGFKRSMHEGGYRVPMIARWPGKIAAGTVSDHPCGAYDFLATACELAGAKPPKNSDGISYLPTLLGKSDQQKQHEYLYCASQEGATSVGVRFGNWKLVKYASPKKSAKKPSADSKPDWRLYDLKHDIGEKNNLAAKHPDIVNKILALLKRDGLL
ncbi:MAG: arylsulfatase [Planctomycetota bacterium]|nr:arylsulfatase [Planctomycetota bacterium]